MDEVTVSAEAAKHVLGNIQRMASEINKLDGVVVITPEATLKLIAAAKLAFPIVRASRNAAAYRVDAKPVGMTYETWKLQSDWALTALRNALYAAGIKLEG